VRLVSALKDLSGVLTGAGLLAVLFPVRCAPCLSFIPSRATNGAFVVLEIVDVLPPDFSVRLLPFRPPVMPWPVFLLSVPGLLSSFALLFSCVLPPIFLAMRDFFGALIRGAGLASGFVTVAAESGFDVLILVATLEVFAELICLRGSGLVLLFTAGGVGFGLLTCVAMREVLAVFV